MSKLRELQQQALDAVLGDDAAPCMRAIDSNGIPSLVRVGIYRNNLGENLRKTLANAYPVVERLTGHDCFRGLAANYSRRHPSMSGDPQNFGEKFPAFLDALYRDTDFAYLPDVAMLEWAIERALISARSLPVDVAELARVDPARHDLIRFLLRPGISLVESCYPVLAIWQANQQAVAPIVDLASGGVRLAIQREDDSAEIRVLDAPTFSLAKCFERGMTLGAASEQLSHSTDFDLSASLNSLFVNRCLGSFQLADGESSDQ